ncbi:oligosaccharide flippase family protein [Rathayibacter sp. VKM Ac-2926]|uniref:oligosaccharide flippase family protein n=1 Tax=Rathayibacter sp. VKM Ac-2926 TaxID=2929477 RepID=UPI001FB35F4F|nr:oligosaccharide flippase family protein [Rathayibacter sp. VKM Ac-2926]MCJ1705368.1 oligosaccharide flippase family protein [Rathayibacter sp. VKM Ac-2926]
MIHRVAALLRSPTARSSSNAALERLVSRGTSAVVGLVVAVHVSPAEAGVYAMAFLALSLLQEIGENTVRPLGVAMWRREGGARQLRRAAAVVSVGGATAMAGAIGLLWALSAASPAQAVALLPFVVVAALHGAILPALTRAQFDGRWASIARGQALGSIASIVVCVPLAPVLGIAAGSLQTGVTEGILLLLLSRRGTLPAPDLPRRPMLRDYVIPTLQSNVFGWLQGQSERIVLSALGEATTLGLYSIASQIARAVSDAVVLGLANVLRARLANSRTDEERRAVLRSVVMQAAVGALVVQTTMVALDLLVLGRVLDSSWHPALLIVPILSVSSAPIACLWCASSYLIVQGRASVLVPWHWIGVALSVGAGFAVAADLLAGACAAVLRDAVALAGRLPHVGQDIGRSGLLRVSGCLAAGVLIGAAGFCAALPRYS